MRHRFRQLLILLGLTALGACSSPTAPPPPPPDAPSLTCPASVSLVSPDGARVPYAFAIPTPVNGQPPVTVSCAGMPAGGSGYPAGSTTVTCTATDALARQASCNFNVTVTVTPKISKTKFLAFGDSITYGRCGPKEPLPNTCPPYTVRLEELLRARYTQQNFSIINVGLQGETADDGEDRLPGVLNEINPEVLLLMEGTNDLNQGEAFVSDALEALGSMIDMALNRGIKVFIATIAPIAPGGTSSSTIPLVAPFNAEIRNLAAQKGVPLVDVYAALNADLPRFYAGNDLHPTADGHRVIGETFYAVIRATLDITPGGPSVMSSALTDLVQPPRRPSPIKRLPGR